MVKKLLLKAANFVGPEYNDHRLRIGFAEFMEYYEWELALDSLIELADETEDDFTHEFWLHLEQAASLMKLSDYQEIIKTKIAGFS